MGRVWGTATMYEGVIPGNTNNLHGFFKRAHIISRRTGFMEKNE
jgi:hypothetical protein